MLIGLLYLSIGGGRDIFRADWGYNVTTLEYSKIGGDYFCNRNMSNAGLNPLRVRRLGFFTAVKGNEALISASFFQVYGAELFVINL